MKTNLFLVAGVVRRLGGSYELTHLGGLYAERAGARHPVPDPGASPWRHAAPVGIFRQVRAGAGRPRIGQYRDRWRSRSVVGLLTLFSMTKIWAEAFWKARTPEEARRDACGRRGACWHYAPIAVLAALTVVLGFAAEPVFSAATEAADAADGTGTLHPCRAGRTAMIGLLWNPAPGPGVDGGDRGVHGRPTGSRPRGSGDAHRRCSCGRRGMTTCARCSSVFGFAGFFLWELVLANLRMARDVLSPRPRFAPGVIAVPLDAQTDARSHCSPT